MGNLPEFIASFGSAELGYGIRTILCYVVRLRYEVDKFQCGRRGNIKTIDYSSTVINFNCEKLKALGLKTYIEQEPVFFR